MHILCHVSWFKAHTKYDWFGHSAIVCQTDVEEDCYINFIPIQCFIAPCTFGYIPVKSNSELTETVFVAVTLPSQLCI